MISYMEIDTAQLDKDIEALNESLAQARNAMKAMMDSLEELNTMWQGRANQAFRMQAARDKVKMESLLEEVRRLSGCMTYASGEYTRCEAEVKGAVDAIRI